MPTNTPTLADMLYDQFLEQIALGNWNVGRRLPTETRLAERFKVSRPVVREALGHLKNDGILTSRQGSGTYVSRSPDVRFLSFASVGNIATLLRCFEFRVGIEGEAAALAAIRRTDEDLAMVEQAMLHARERVEPVLSGLEADSDFDFHLAVAEGVQQRLLCLDLQIAQASDPSDPRDGTGPQPIHGQEYGARGGGPGRTPNRILGESATRFPIWPAAPCAPISNAPAAAF